MSGTALGTQYILSVLKFIHNSVLALKWFITSLERYHNGNRRPALRIYCLSLRTYAPIPRGFRLIPGCPEDSNVLEVGEMGNKGD